MLNVLSRDETCYRAAWDRIWPDRGAALKHRNVSSRCSSVDFSYNDTVTTESCTPCLIRMWDRQRSISSPTKLFPFT